MIIYIEDNVNKIFHHNDCFLTLFAASVPLKKDECFHNIIIFKNKTH